MARILTVDDSASMREMICFTLKSAGHDVTEAEDGVGALELARATTFDLVLIDINMPRMDGLALLRALRSHIEYKATPLLLLTTEAAADRKQEGRAAGATGWIVKPFSPDQLVAIMHRLLG
jgi:two-component system, chemotaxis family, chemotaxis protein CheY